MSRTNAVTATNNFIKAFSHPEQFQHILKHIASPAPTQSEIHMIINLVLTSKPSLLIDVVGITLFGMTVPFKVLFKETLQALSHILSFQRNRRTLFNEVITQTYSIRYYNFSMNTQIDAVVPRDKLIASVLQHFQTLDKATTREYVLTLREKNATNYSFLKHFDIILN
tara:strand:+ start:160 stop:663 length:504 start_codon:yes stop_codon:yes gene_type:complete